VFPAHEVVTPVQSYYVYFEMTKETLNDRNVIQFNIRFRLTSSDKRIIIVLEYKMINKNYHVLLKLIVCGKPFNILLVIIQR